jgi:TRAP-type C4-dicarboxylate transport system substrate-binding protein
VLLWVNKKLLITLVLVLIGALTGCSSSSKSAPSTPDQGKKQETVELKLAHFFPATHAVESQLIQPWAKAIADVTNGQVKVTSYPGETLLKADGVYDGVATGVADIGLSCFTYTRGRFPVLEAFELPGVIYSNSRVASKVAWEGIKQLNPKEVQDTKLMMVFATGPGDLYTKTPVKNLNDIKGMAIRATGLSAKTLIALGANPVAMTQAEAYEALSKGTVKGNLAPIEALQGFKQAEVTKYITRTPFIYNTPFFLTMNLDKWNSLSPETQKAIEEVNNRYYEEVAMGLWDKLDDSALKYALQDNGMTEIKLTDEEANRWIALVKPIQDEFVAKLNEKSLPGQQALDTAKSLADKYNAEYK